MAVENSSITSEAQGTSASSVPSKEQIQRLKALQGTDKGIFKLACFSIIEGYLREKLGKQNDFSISFPSLLDMFKARYSTKHPKEYMLIKDLITNHRGTNPVRHRFMNCSAEEANGAIFLFCEFAKIYNLPNQEEIEKLSKALDVWLARKSPVETAAELENAIKQIKSLSEQNENMLEKVSQLGEVQNQLDAMSSKLKALQFDYDQQIAANKKNKERIDELRRAKNDEEQKNLKAQKELQTQLEKLSDAEEYIQNLNRMTSYTRTRYDFEQSIVHLTKEQESIVNQVKFNRDFLIKGSAGTGKSLVLLKTLEKLLAEQSGSLFASDKNKSIKLITFTHSLEKYNRYIASLMKIGKTELAENNDIITTSETYISKILKAAFPQKELNYILDKVEIECLEDENVNPLGKEIWTELDKFILPKCITKKEYCEEMIARTGMRKPQNEASRKKIWAVVEKIFDAWEKSDEWYSVFAAYKLATTDFTVPENLCVDYLFVDEAQDLTAATLRILKSSVREAVILAGDNDQSIFQPGFTWSRAGLDVSGATRILNINFRSTNQINEVAEKYRKLIKGSDKENRPETFRLGPPVELHESKNEDEGFTQIIETVKLCIKTLGYESENICLIAPQKKQLDKLKTLLKDELDLESSLVSEGTFDFAQQGIIRLATTQSCKGLDFPVVLFYIDHRAHYLDVFDEEISDKINRNMIYTALTRSIELLHVFMPQKVSEGPVGDLKKILKEEK